MPLRDRRRREWRINAQARGTAAAPAEIRDATAIQQQAWRDGFLDAK